MSKTRLEEIRGRLEKASPAPWKWFVWEPKGCGEVSWESGNGHCSIVGDNAVAMTRIFGAAQSDLAYLLSQIDTLTREKNEAIREAREAAARQIDAEELALRKRAASLGQHPINGLERRSVLQEARICERLSKLIRAASVLTPPAESRGDSTGAIVQEVMSGETPSDGNAFVSRGAE